jgi:serine/threonine protein kinase
MGDLETVSQQTTGCWPAGDNPPPTVSDYDLLRLIGQGGFGQVWLAKNRTTGHLRAVKVIPLHRSGTTDPAGREITSLTRLEANLRRQHPNLLNIHHVGTTPAYVFYVMDLADDASGNPGSSQPDYRPATLQSRLEAGPLAAEQCLCYARQLLAGLASLHQAGMVHRDVKPANCLFVDGELKLADFGLVTEANPQVSRVGTLKYMPPDGHMDTRADVYAAGLVIYEMLTGLPVESFPRLGDRAQQAVETPILGMLNRVALRACEPDPQRRFRDAGEMLAHLQKRGSELPSAHPNRSRKRLLAPFLLATLAVIVLSGLAALGLWASRPARVHVNFVTHPFEATIYLDNVLQVDTEGNPYTTPCTIENLPARVHRVVFKHPGLESLEVGLQDFAQQRRIEAHWKSKP